MHLLRTKKLKNPTQKYLPAPFDDNLVQVILDKNQKCIQQITKNHYQKAKQLLKQIKFDTELMSDNNRQKYILKVVSINTQVYFCQKMKKYPDALNLLSQAQLLQKEHSIGPIEMARTKLNKSVILSLLDRHQQSLNLCKQALELLKRKRECERIELRNNQYKLYEIMTISLYNIAIELSHLKDDEEAKKVYKEGYHLAQRNLGQSHKLTLLLKSIVKSKVQQSRQKLQIHQSFIDNSKEKLNVFDPLAACQRERELKRIYASKKRFPSLEQDRRSSRKELEYYLKSLEKIKEMYSKRKKDQKRIKLNTTIVRGERKSRLRYKGLMTEQSQPKKRQSQLGYMKSVEKSKLYSSQNHEIGLNNNGKTTPLQLDPICEPKRVKTQEKEVQMFRKVEERKQKDQEGCQLI